MDSNIWDKFWPMKLMEESESLCIVINTHTQKKESELSTQHHWPKMNSLRETVPWRSWWKQTYIYISHSQPKHFPSVDSYGLLHLPLYTVERSWACEEGYSTWLDTTMKLKLSPSADSILSECRIIWCALHNSSFYYFLALAICSRLH